MTTAAAAAEVPTDEPAIPEAAEPTDDARLMDHDYDGIREYDNPLPGWWKAIFVGSIIFAGFYGLYFHVVGWGRSPADHYRDALARYDERRDDRERLEIANITEATLAQKVDDPKVVARGAEVFATRCASCHGPAGAGLIGPNLTDDRQIHGDSRLDTYRVVRGGAAGTAMMAWGDQLPAADVVAASAFAITLRGKMLPGKVPEGLPVKAFSP